MDFCSFSTLHSFLNYCFLILSNLNRSTHKDFPLLCSHYFNYFMKLTSLTYVLNYASEFKLFSTNFATEIFDFLIICSSAFFFIKFTQFFQYFIAFLNAPWINFLIHRQSSWFILQIIYLTYLVTFNNLLDFIYFFNSS